MLEEEDDGDDFGEAVPYGADCRRSLFLLDTELFKPGEEADR